MSEFKIGDRIWVFVSFSDGNHTIYLEDFYLCECIVTGEKINSHGHKIFIVYDVCDAPGQIVYETVKEKMYHSKFEALSHLLEVLI